MLLLPSGSLWNNLNYRSFLTTTQNFIPWVDYLLNTKSLKATQSHHSAHMESLSAWTKLRRTNASMDWNDPTHVNQFVGCLKWLFCREFVQICKVDAIEIQIPEWKRLSPVIKGVQQTHHWSRHSILWPFSSSLTKFQRSRFNDSPSWSIISRNQRFRVRRSELVRNSLLSILAISDSNGLSWSTNKPRTFNSSELWRQKSLQNSSSVIWKW